MQKKRNETMGVRWMAALCALAAALMAGCETVTELSHPQQLPLFVKSYEGALLAAKTRRVTCSLNLVNCVKDATVVRRKLSGAREPGPTFPMREVVAAEFDSVIDTNFRRVVKSEQDVIELKVESRRVLLERDGGSLACDIELAVMILPANREGKPYFSKTYRWKANGETEDERCIPGCVYECVQHIADQFVAEINGDPPLVERLAKASEERESK